MTSTTMEAIEVELESGELKKLEVGNFYVLNEYGKQKNIYITGIEKELVTKKLSVEFIHYYDLNGKYDNLLGKNCKLVDITGLKLSKDQKEELKKVYKTRKEQSTEELSKNLVKAYYVGVETGFEGFTDKSKLNDILGKNSNNTTHGFSLFNYESTGLNSLGVMMYSKSLYGGSSKLKLNNLMDKITNLENQYKGLFKLIVDTGVSTHDEYHGYTKSTELKLYVDVDVLKVDNMDNLYDNLDNLLKKASKLFV